MISVPDKEAEMEAMTIAGKSVRLFPSERPDAPLVWLHTVKGEGESVYRAVRGMTDRPFSFAAVGGLRWEEEMTPWPCPPLFKGDKPFSGGADAYLETLTDKLLPEVTARLPAAPAYLALAGYSLAGLFAAYALYRTDAFARIACASGSFWYPGFLDYAETHMLKRRPERVWFSVGDREAGTRHEILRSVEENTRALHARYEREGIETIFEMNPGNHFRDAEQRMAKGIAWILAPRDEDCLQANIGRDSGS